jgi:hypothetical protein
MPPALPCKPHCAATPPCSLLSFTVPANASMSLPSLNLVASKVSNIHRETDDYWIYNSLCPPRPLFLASPCTRQGSQTFVTADFYNEVRQVWIPNLWMHGQFSQELCLPLYWGLINLTFILRIAASQHCILLLPGCDTSSKCLGRRTMLKSLVCFKTLYVQFFC